MDESGTASTSANNLLKLALLLLLLPFLAIGLFLYIPSLFSILLGTESTGGAKTKLVCIVFLGGGAVAAFSDGSDSASRSSRNMLVLILNSSTSSLDFGGASADGPSNSRLKSLAGTVVPPFILKSLSKVKLFAVVGPFFLSFL